MHQQTFCTYARTDPADGGKAEALPDAAGAKIFRSQNFGKWKLIYQRDGELGGGIDAEDPVAARAFLKKVLEGTGR